MKRSIAVTALAFLWAGGVHAAGNAGVSAGAEGLIRFDPPQALGCVAVRVDVPSDQMLTGVRWWNGSSALSFPKVLVASGSGDEPPAYSEAMVAAACFSLYGDVVEAKNTPPTVVRSTPRRQSRAAATTGLASVSKKAQITSRAASGSAVRARTT